MSQTTKSNEKEQEEANKPTTNSFDTQPKKKNMVQTKSSFHY